MISRVAHCYLEQFSIEDIYTAGQGSRRYGGFGVRGPHLRIFGLLILSMFVLYFIQNIGMCGKSEGG